MLQLELITDFTPVDITTAEGYNEFIQSPLCSESSTVFPDDSTDGYVLVNNEVIATVSGEVKDSLFNYPQYPQYSFLPSDFKASTSQKDETQKLPSTPKPASSEPLSSPESCITETP